MEFDTSNLLVTAPDVRSFELSPGNVVLYEMVTKFAAE